MKTEFISSIPGFRHLLREGSIDFSLRSTSYKIVLILVVGIPVVLLAFRATQVAVAARIAGRLNSEDLRRAIALDPGNAAYYRELGLIDSYSLEPAKLRKAVGSLRKATELNPLGAVYWSDLADVCDMLNDATCSNPAVKRALTLSPMTPRFEWQAGNHCLETGHTNEALEHFRVLLAMDESYAQPVFRISLAAVGNPAMVFQKVLPSEAKPKLKLAFLDFVSSQGNIDFANSIWRHISSSHLSCKFSHVGPYLTSLVSAGDFPQAERVWFTLEHEGVIAKQADRGGKNLVYNGGFEHSPVNAGFGWHGSNTPYVEMDFRDPSAYQGSRCLRVDYAAGQNLESQPVYQLIPVEPQRTYQLRAYVRSDDITSQSGPRLRVMDPERPACLNVATTATVGTTPWHMVTLDFATGPKAQVIRLSIWRPRCWTFPMEISGSFWLDNVSIEPLHSTSKDADSIH